MSSAGFFDGASGFTIGRTVSVFSMWLAVVIVISAVGWTGYRFSVLRMAASEIAHEARSLQAENRGLEGEVLAFRTAFLTRPVAELPFDFMYGLEWMPDSTRANVVLQDPSDGIYLTVAWDCPWSQSAVDIALGIAAQANRQVILLDPIFANGVRWVDQFPNTMAPRILTPDGGWWSFGLPQGVTPVWFAVSEGQVIDVGVGAPSLEDLSFGPVVPNVIMSDANQIHSEGG